MLFVCKESTLPSKEGEPKRHRPQKAVHMNIWQSLFLSQTGNRPQSSLVMAHSPIPHDLVTVANFADTLDALPLELTRGFSDLRELDAVLSCSCFFLPSFSSLAPPSYKTRINSQLTFSFLDSFSNPFGGIHQSVDGDLAGSDSHSRREARDSSRSRRVRSTVQAWRGGQDPSRRRCL